MESRTVLIGTFSRFFGTYLESRSGFVDGKASSILRDIRRVAAHFGWHRTPWDDNVCDTTYNCDT